MDFKLHTPYPPAGDQPKAIQQLNEGIATGMVAQTLLGVTGSGKTYTMAQVIASQKRPALVLCHNKTLAAQLYGEFRQFFPENAVEYFISYYDYYQPEAYMPATGTYIEKELRINDEIEKLRLRATTALLSGRSDVVVVASVSCIYGLGNPETFAAHTFHLAVGDRISQRALMERLLEMLYQRQGSEFNRGFFRAKGDSVDVFVAHADFAYRFIFWDDEIECIQRIDPSTGERLGDEERIRLFPANLFIADRKMLKTIVREIQDDLVAQLSHFRSEGFVEYSERLKARVEYDLEMIRSLGYCAGVENYSRYFDRRDPGMRPFCLLDYFPKDYLLFVDESHVAIPQVRGMWGGDRSRKINLVKYGFRLPAALDNRPLTFSEFEALSPQSVFVSATPADYELMRSEGVVVEQIIRPTGLVDPPITVRPSKQQMDDILKEIRACTSKDQRVLITTLTKRMAEKLARFLSERSVSCCYMHSEVKALDRVALLRALRIGTYDVLVGVNLLREGLDLPEVSLVIILDADKEGFLRNARSLIQTIGRAARNEEGRVLFYADQVTPSMEQAIEETERRRELQLAFNKKHDITPRTITKDKTAIMEQTRVADVSAMEQATTAPPSITQDPVLRGLSTQKLQIMHDKAYAEMNKVAKTHDFMRAALLRDEWQALATLLETREG